MKKVKGIIVFCGIVLVIAVCISAFVALKNWPIRYRSELDRFFGGENWECVSKETKTSILLEEYVRVRENPGLSGNVPGKYQNWAICFSNRRGEKEVWNISNHTLKLNHDKYGVLSKKRYSGRQALGLELMEISFEAVSEEVHENVVQEVFPEREAECIEVELFYEGGNPEPDFYDYLWEQEWFTAEDATAEDYLNCDRHEFYLYVRAHDYRVNGLTDEERAHLFTCLDELIEKMFVTYGENASFEIYLGDGYSVEYKDGEVVR